MQNSSKIEIDSNTTYRPVKSFRTSFGDKLSTFAKKFFDSSQILVVILGIFALLYLFIAQFSVVDGPSMLNNFDSGDLTVYEKVTTTLGHLKRGDVVVFQSPDGRDFIKRVIGLPGESIKVQDGKVYVNEKPLTEDYLSDINKYVRGGTTYTEGITITSNDKEYALFGDNRTVSHDSRDLGPITLDKIKGKVLVVFWPINKFHFIKDIQYSNF